MVESLLVILTKTNRNGNSNNFNRDGPIVRSKRGDEPLKLQKYGRANRRTS